MVLSENYLNDLRASNGLIYQSEENISFQFRVHQAEYNIPWLIIRNKTFWDLVKIQDVNIHVGIKFENCVFKQGVALMNLRTNEETDSEFSIDPISIHFKECNFESTVQLDGSASLFENSIVFEDCKKITDVIINNITIVSGDIVFEACKDITGAFLIQGTKIGGELIFDESIINTLLKIDSGSMRSIEFDECRIQSTYITAVVINELLVFYDSEVLKEVQLEVISGKNASLSLQHSVFTGPFSIRYQHKRKSVHQGFNGIYLESCDFNDGFIVEGKQEWIGKFDSSPLVEAIEIKMSSRMKGDIFFQSLDVGSFLVTGVNSNSILRLEDIQVCRFYCDHFSNYMQLALIGVRASLETWLRKDQKGEITGQLTSVFKVVYSNLGKTQLFKVDLSSFKEISIIYSIVSEIEFSNVTWFPPGELGIDLKSWEKGHKKSRKKVHERDVLPEQYNARKEIFRQLKMASEKNQDKVQSFIFQRWEMYYYEKYLKILGSKKWDDRLILEASKTNDFGLSWLRALAFTILFTYLLFIPIALIASPRLEPSLSFQSSDVAFTINEVFYNQFPNYFQFLNPAHFLDRIYPQIHEKPGIIYLLDALHRIVTAFFIFQIVSAFRKYVKQ